MKIAGHTMGTPEYSLPDAIKLFNRIGLEGVEIVVQEGYGCALPERPTHDVLLETRNLVGDMGLEVSALTPYFSRFNDLDKKVRQQEVDGLRRVIGSAAFLGAPFIRIYAGNYPLNDTDPTGEKEAHLVKSMQILGDDARASGVSLVLENHFNTMTVSAASSIRISRLIDRKNVGILYDQANLVFTNCEGYEQAITLQSEKILYTHVKDLKFKSEDHSFVSSDVSHQKKDERNVITRIVGEGSLDWPAILKFLHSTGYDGWLSLEYERRWHPQDIPDASIGMQKSAQYIRDCLMEL